MDTYKQSMGIITAVELNIGDNLIFELVNSEQRKITLLETDAQIICTNKTDLSDDEDFGASLYKFSCKILIDSHEIIMERYVGCQESFYMPYIINGMMICINSVKKIFDIFPEGHGNASIEKDAVFVVHDASQRLCDEDIQPWYDDSDCYIDIKDCYDSDDCYFGAYHGSSIHTGMDVNHPAGSKLYAPINLDTQYLFNSLKMGDNNNRWRGVKKQRNGEMWFLQTHHLINLTIDEYTNLKAGQHYANGAGVYVGSHEHSHFMFKITEKDGNFLDIDPWHIIKDSFESQKKLPKPLYFHPSSPLDCNKEYNFTPSIDLQSKNIIWDFDGFITINSRHIFLKSGLKRISFYLLDKKEVYTQYITVDGDEKLDYNQFSLEYKNNPTFSPIPNYVMNVYINKDFYFPNTIDFKICKNINPIQQRKFNILNINENNKDNIIIYDLPDWLKHEITSIENFLEVTLTVDMTNKNNAKYNTIINISDNGSINKLQTIYIDVIVADEIKENPYVLDIEDKGVYITPYSWVGHRFTRWDDDKRGYNSFSRYNAVNDSKACIVLKPMLPEGDYEICLHENTVFLLKDAAMTLIIKNKNGKHIKTINPDINRSFGVYNYSYINDDYIMLTAQGIVGSIVADALVFKKQ